MSSMAAKLNKYFKTALPDEFVVHIIMQSLPKEYETFHVNYNNTVKDQWTLDQLMAQCVQEEERIKARRGDSVNLAQLKKKNVNSRSLVRVDTEDKAPLVVVAALPESPPTLMGPRTFLFP